MITREVKELSYDELRRYHVWAVTTVAVYEEAVVAEPSNAHLAWSCGVVQGKELAIRVELHNRERDFLEATPIGVVLNAAGVPHTTLLGRTCITI